MTRTIFFDGEFTSLNDYINAERTNRHIAAKIKKYETQRVRLCAIGVLPIEKYPVRIKFTWFRMDHRTDPDNVAFAKKFILDGLQKAKVMKGDGCRHICGFEDCFVFDPARAGVQVEITEM